MIIENIIDFHQINNKLIGGGTSKKNELMYTKLFMYKTNNDLKCLLIPLLNSTTVTVGFFIPSGSRNEKDAFGIAHFLEHMTFKGTINRTSTQLMLQLDSMGAHYNAMTSYEYTIYYVSGDPNDIDIIFDIIIDLYLNPLFPEEDIMKERNVVLEEFLMGEDNNHGVLSKKINNVLYKDIDDGLSRPIIGYKHTIEKFTRDDILKYRKENYDISKCLLCISGNFNKKKIKNKIKKKFKTNLKHLKTDINIIDNLNFKHILDMNKNINNNNRHININKDINQTIINFYFNIFDKNNINCINIDILCDILSNGFSSRLFNLLRNKMGVSYYNNSYSRSFIEYGNLIISVGVDNDSVLYTIEEILKELNDIRINGISNDELNKAKKQNKTNLLFQFKDPYEYLMYYSMNILDKLPLYNLSEQIKQIHNVSLDQINNICKLIFNNNNIIIGTIGKITDEQSKIINNLINKSFT